MLASIERPQYKSDNSLSWHLLPIAIAVITLAAIGLTWLLMLAYVHGRYLIFVLPCSCGAALGGGVYVHPQPREMIHRSFAR